MDPEQTAALLARLDELEAWKNRTITAPLAIRNDDPPANYYEHRSPVIAPPLERTDYEIKASMINLVKQHQFHGLTNENPIEHIEGFETICSTTKSQGVPDTYNNCKLFQFSLAGKAERWYKALAPNSLDGWEETRSAFLNFFFTKAKTAALKQKISSFKQLNGESFSEAWERFQEYQRDCPHHGFPQRSLLTIFYDGVDWDYKNQMNAASNGDFQTQSQDGAFKLIENLVKSSTDRSKEYDRGHKVNSIDSVMVKEINEKLNQLLKAQQKEVRFSKPEVSNVFEQQVYEDTTAEDECEVNYVNGQGFQQRQGFNANYRNHPNLSYRSPNVENPQDQYYPPQVQQQGQGFQPKPQGFQPRPQTTNAFQPRQQSFAPAQTTNSLQQQSFAPSAPPQPAAPVNPLSRLEGLIEQVLLRQDKAEQRTEAVYTELNGKFDALAAHVKRLDVQAAQTAEAIKQQPGVLPGRVETNPRGEHIRAIAKQEAPAAEPSKHVSEIVTPPATAKSEGPTRKKDRTALNRPPLPYSQKPSESVLELDKKKSTVKELDQASGYIKASEDCNTEIKQPALSSPQSQLNASEEAQVRILVMMEQFMRKQLESTEKTIGRYEELNGAFDYLFATVKKLEVQVAQYHEGVQQLLILWSGRDKYWNKRLAENPASSSLQRSEETRMNRQDQNHRIEAEAPQLRSLQKKEDPGQFVVPCSINGVNFKDSMCDSGSSINLMPREVATRLGFTNLQPSKITLALADSSTTVPLGMIADLDIRIGDCLVPTDFQVVEISNEGEVPLILGRPFMATAGAVMDLPRSRLSFTKIDEEVFYDILPRPELAESASCIWAVKKKEEACTKSKDKPALPPPAPKRPPKKKTVCSTKPRPANTPLRNSQPFAQISIHIPEEFHCLAINDIREKLLTTMDLFPDVRSWECKGDKMIGRIQRQQSLHAGFSRAKGKDSEDDPVQS